MRGVTFAEAAAISTPQASYVNTFIGDPLMTFTAELNLSPEPSALLLLLIGCLGLSIGRWPIPEAGERQVQKR